MVPQIIVCDDEPHIIRAISLKFNRSGFDVKAATDVESCWRLMHRNPVPAFLIVDDSLESGPDGLELIRRVRADANLADVPVILLTTQNFDLYEYKEQLSDYGIAQILTKPFSPRELLTTVCSFLHHNDTSKGPAFMRNRNMQSVV